ncbi:unnamed protein product [Acanthosepion pharaonis]|uniref:Myb/SANT-like DNA-binding domain-containing protein n=1 Tax=Acanthosepion pharaonis TaxID=158019 RepID=A0A812EGV0_ACAPH|nr:unnamed protein product [Sepia pharaonis]
MLSESSQEFDSRQKNGASQSAPNGDLQQQFLRSKKRADNYSRKDKERLIKLVTSRLDVLENKVSNTCVNLQKAQCWVEIANEYNKGTASSDYWRDDRQLKDLWKRMKFTARSDLIRYARQKERKDSAKNNDDGGGPASSLAHEILDDFTLILLRLVPAHFQMDTDGKVLQVIDELLALSPAEVEEQKVLSRNRRQQRRQQMTGHYGNQDDDDDDDDDDAVVLIEVNNRLDNSPDNDPVVILESCLPPPPPQCSNNPNTTSATGTPVTNSNERLDNNSQETNFYTEAVVTPQLSTSVAGNISHRTQVIDVHTGVENGQLQRQHQTSQPLLPPLTSASTTSLQQQPQIEQQQILHEEPIFTFKSEEDTVINDASRQNWYIEQIASRNQFDDVVNDTTSAIPEKDYQYRRKRKNPFYRTLLEDDQNEEMRQQLIEMARKENEKEMQLLDIQTQCEKQRLVREKMETENAVLKQRLLLQLLQSQINKDQGLPSISLLL